MNHKIFKAYDIRGIYPDEINEIEVKEIAIALANNFKRGKLVVGRDARLSSPSLAKVVKKIFKESEKHELIDIGVVTTPMFYFLVNELKAVGGVMITASHTPKEFNGLKVVGPKAIVISGEELLKEIKK